MAVETVGYWNASYIFESIELADDAQELFLENFTTGDSLTSLTLVSRYKFFTMLKDFVTKVEYDEAKEALLKVQHWYPEAKYVNVEA